MKRILLAALVAIVLLLLILGATARLGWWPVDATATPSTWENEVGQSVLRASLNRQARGLINPIPPSNEVLMAGMKIFKMNCAGCHGEPRQPSQWGTKGFYPRVPQFVDHPPALSAPQMFVAVKHGIRYSGMGAWDGLLSDQQIWEVVTFLSNLKSLPPSVAERWKNPPQ